MKLLLNIDYTDGTGTNGRGSFWAESMINNKIVEQTDNETIHETVGRAIQDIDHAEVLYKGKPQNNVFIDNKNGDQKIVGYIYRVKHFISNRSQNIQCYALFDAWVNIKAIDNIKLEDIEQ